MRLRKVTLSLAALAVLACGGDETTGPEAADRRAPDGDTTSALERSARTAASTGPGSSFELDSDATTVGELLGEVSIALPSERDTTGTAVLFPPDSVDPVEGPVIVEVAGRIEIGDGGEGRVSDLVDRGLVGWQTPDGQQRARPAGLGFRNVTAEGPGSALREVEYSGSARDSFRVRGTMARGEGLEVEWLWGEPDDLGEAPDPGDIDGKCILDIFSICIVFSRRDIQEADSPPGGRIRVRAFRAGGDASVAIDSIGTPNLASAGTPTFTTLRDDADVTVAASTMPDSLMSEVEWTVRPVSTEIATPTAPDEGALETGESITWAVPEQEAGRMERFPHPGTVEQKALAFEIEASVEADDGDTLTSEPDTIRQDEIDTVREEYVELGHVRGVPLRSGLPDRAGQRRSKYRRLRGRGRERGVRAAVAGRAAAVRARPPVADQLDLPQSRAPEIHLRGDPDSFHQDGCAVDLQTFPRRGADGEFDTQEQRRSARAYWDELAASGTQANLEVERIQKSGIGHVHLERDPCLEGNNRPFP